MEIKLDTNAVRSLFPEGSEARVKLQQAVINNIVNEMIKVKTNEKLKEHINESVKEHVKSLDLPNISAMCNEAIKDVLERVGFGFRFNNKGAVLVREAIDGLTKETLIEAGLYSVIEDILKQQNALLYDRKRIKEITENQLEYRKSFFDATVIRYINENVDKLVKKALKETYFNADNS